MTITYHAGNRIQGLSTDTVETLTYSNVYSTSTGLVASNSQVSVTGGVLQILHRLTATNDSAYYDLSSYNISDTAWTLRFKFNCSARSSSASNPNTAGLFYLSSTNDNDMTSNGIGLKWMLGGGGNNPTTVDLAGGSSNQTSAEGYVWGTTTTTGITSAGTTKWIEITRNGSTIYLKIYSDAFVTLQETVSATFTGTISGLKYLSYKARNNNTASWTATFNIDDLYFYNGVSSVNSKPTNVPTNSRFEETDTRKIYYSNPLAADGLGSTVNLSVTGSPTRTATGKLGSYALGISSSGNYASVDYNVIGGTGDFAISVWVYPTNVSAYNEMVDSYINSVPQGWEFTIYQGNVFFYFNQNSNRIQTSSAGISNNNWYHIVVTRTSGVAKIYVNGADQTITTTGSQSATLNSNARFRIGDLEGLGSGYQLNGSIDEVSVWSRGLTSGEIASLYNSGNGATPFASGISLTGLKAYYNFEQTTGNLINQASPTSLWNQVN